MIEPQALTQSRRSRQGYQPDHHLLADYDHILKQCQICGILLDEQNEAVHIFGDAGELLSFHDGRLNRNALELLPNELRISASSAVQRAALSKEVTRTEPINVELPSHSERIEVIATPIAHRSGVTHILLAFRRSLLTIEKTSEENTVTSLKADDSYRQYITDLELEVKATRENLQATIEELQTTIEELQSTNEELQSANEELQSSNEELHSVNEELHTVNSEYEQKNSLLAEVNRDLESLLDNTDFGIVFVENNLRIRRFNRGAQSLFRFAIQDIGRDLGDIVNYLPADVDLIEHMRNVLREGRSKEITCHTRDGRHHLVRFIPYTGDNNVCVGALITATDVTDMKQLEERLRHGQRLESLGRLAGGIAHDFNNIICAIQGYAETIHHKKNEPANHNAIQSILASTQRASSLTANLLSFGRKARNKLQVIDVHKAIHSAIEMVGHKFSSTTSITCKLDAENAALEGDEAQIQSVFLNILLNAHDAMPDGGSVLIVSTNTTIVKNLTVETRPEIAPGQYIQIDVADNGTGMSPATIEHIFEPYYTTKGMNGNGLGMAAAHGVISEHKGGIAIQSNHHGTTVSIYLPASQHQPVHTPAVEYTPPENAALNNKKILVVDDEEPIRELLEDILHDMGCVVTLADNGQQALDIFALTNDFDIVLSDMTMPFIDGAKLAKLIKDIKSDTPVILMSGNPSDFQSQIDQDLINGVVSKPFAINELTQSLAQVIKNSSG